MTQRCMRSGTEPPNERPCYVSPVDVRAPLAVAVEVKGSARRCFRVSRSIGEDGVRLQRPAPFEPGQPVDVRFWLPDGEPGGVAAQANVRLADDDAEDESAGGRELRFIAPTEQVRLAIRRYVRERLGLPALPGS
jgi:PilZ domain-containing protein